MPHTKTPKPCKRTKKVKRKSKNNKLWHFWYYEWAETEWSKNAIYYKGAFDEVCDDFHLFLENKLFPGIKKGYIRMEDEYGEELRNIPDDDLDQEVVIRFRPCKLMNRMHRYLARDIFEDHCMAMEECGI